LDPNHQEAQGLKYDVRLTQDNDLAHNGGDVRRIYLLGKTGDSAGATAGDDGRSGQTVVSNFNELLENSGDHFPERIRVSPKRDVALLSFTVGGNGGSSMDNTSSEGRPRLLSYTHQQIIAALSQAQSASLPHPSLRPGAVIACSAPFSSLDALLLGLHAPMLGGVSVLCCDSVAQQNDEQFAGASAALAEELREEQASIQGARAFVSLVAQHGVSAAVTIPTAFKRLSDELNHEPDSLATLAGSKLQSILTVGAPVAHGSMAAMCAIVAEERTKAAHTRPSSASEGKLGKGPAETRPFDVRQAYGMAEMCGVCFGPVAAVDIDATAAKALAAAAAGGVVLKRGSGGVADCGKLLAGCSCKIVATSNGELLGPNKAGELYVKGPQLMPMPVSTDATREMARVLAGGQEGGDDTIVTHVVDGLWLRTGDIGYMDPEGCIFVVGRRDELITTTDGQVSAAELEAQLMAHPSVANAAVLGQPLNYLASDGAEGPASSVCAPVALVVLKSSVASGAGGGVQGSLGGAGLTRAGEIEAVQKLFQHSQEYARRTRKPAKFLRDIKVVSASQLPRSHTGRLLRDVVRLTAKNMNVGRLLEAPLEDGSDPALRTLQVQASGVQASGNSGGKSSSSSVRGSGSSGRAGKAGKAGGSPTKSRGGGGSKSVAMKSRAKGGATTKNTRTMSFMAPTASHSSKTRKIR
jgi:acyl-CoA synthetase (AMP-forming)/AMP-acid ligase II